MPSFKSPIYAYLEVHTFIFFLTCFNIQKADCFSHTVYHGSTSICPLSEHPILVRLTFNPLFQESVVCSDRSALTGLSRHGSTCFPTSLMFIFAAGDIAL